MKKIFAAATVGLMLVAGQAAATTGASARVGDRVGAQAGEASELASVPLPLIAVGAIVGAVVFFNEVIDDSESD
jgi:hypothetical protein